MKVAIIGLGLIGGSIARRLRGFHNCTATVNRENCQYIVLIKLCISGQTGKMNGGFLQ